jgi:ABC-type multidrug transport system fused ATPase/permease subunit
MDLRGDIEVENLSVDTEEGVRLLSGIDLSLKHGEHLAVVGFSGSGKSTLAGCIGQLQKYTGGLIRIGGREVSRLSKADVAGNVGYVSQSPFIFDGSIEDNLLYGCLALRGTGTDEKSDVLPGLDDRILVLQQTGLFADVLRFGLDTVLDPQGQEELVEQVMAARPEFRDRYSGELADWVEFYDRDRFLYHSSLAENILFGEARCPEFALENLTSNEMFRRFLQETGLFDPLVDLGGKVARKWLSISREPPQPDGPQNGGPIEADALVDCEKVVFRLRRKDAENLDEESRKRLLEAALRFVPKRHETVDLPDGLEEKVLRGRKAFRDALDEVSDSGNIAFCNVSGYMYEQSILTNIFFGKIKDDTEAVRNRINTLIRRFLVETEFMEDIVELGMRFQVGSNGENLSGGQRQKLAIARAFLKKPPILIMDEAISGLDNESQKRIQQQLENAWKGNSTLIGIAHRLDTIRNHDRVAVMKEGKIVEMGAYDELMKRRGQLFGLVNGQHRASGTPGDG